MPKKKVRWVTTLLAFLTGGLGGGFGGAGGISPVGATSCPDVMGVFVRGSGEERWDGINYLAFRESLETKLHDSGLSYGFVDLDYPAVGINFGVAVSAFFSGGKAYEFGASVYRGVAELKHLVSSGCDNTRYVLGGYSQGAMVITLALPELDSERILYAATFGDPKLYLPEGAGPAPAACYNRGLSNYRMYVPDCLAHNGKLGGQNPYQPTEYIDKLGTWCNKHDLMCSPFFSISAHTSYVADNLYEDASRVIFKKIAEYYHIENKYVTPHDTAFLIDSTSSMSLSINVYTAEALRLARETLENGGRVALYDYRDLSDPYQPVKHCDFETCDIEKFTAGLKNIETLGGGDEPESLLSASYHVMKELNWKVGHTKSMVVLTDALYLAPDRDGVTFEDVVRLSKQIDPVNFYIITEEDFTRDYQGLAEATDGKVVALRDDLSLLTDQILERGDSLPRVEEVDGYGLAGDLPELRLGEVNDFGDSVEIHFENNGSLVLVTMNDAWLGLTDSGMVTITELDRGIENRITLTPVSDSLKGEPVEMILQEKIPRVPDTGMVR